MKAQDKNGLSKGNGIDTEELRSRIREATDIDDYLTANREYLLSGSLSEYLTGLLEEKNMSRAEVVRGSLLDRAYVYQIFSGEKRPSRDKLLALAFGLKLNEAETQKLLKLSGNRELYARDERDAAILFALQHNKTIMETNELLYSHKLSILGALS